MTRRLVRSRSVRTSPQPAQRTTLGGPGGGSADAGLRSARQSVSTALIARGAASCRASSPSNHAQPRAGPHGSMITFCEQRGARRWPGGEPEHDRGRCGSRASGTTRPRAARSWAGSPCTDAWRPMAAAAQAGLPAHRHPPVVAEAESLYPRCGAAQLGHHLVDAVRTPDPIQGEESWCAAPICRRARLGAVRIGDLDPDPLPVAQTRAAPQACRGRIIRDR